MSKYMVDSDFEELPQQVREPRREVSPPGFWTDERVEILRDMITRKKSSGEIAAALGTTRNAIIGKALRLKLQLCSQVRTIRPVKPKAKPRRLRPVASQVKIMGNDRVILMSPNVALPKAEPEQTPTVPRRSLFELDDVPEFPRFCRWPYGDGPFVFCACRTVPGKPYCRPHNRRTRT